MESTKVKNMKEYLNLKRNNNEYKYYELLKNVYMKVYEKISIKMENFRHEK